MLLIFAIPLVIVAQTDTLSIQEFQDEYPDGDAKSQSKGTHGNGSLTNGKLMPYKGANFQYFDSSSYVHSRAFVNDKVKKAVLEAYETCDSTCGGYTFILMECSNKNGG